MREEAVKKERDEHFNDIQSVIPMKQEWRVKEKANTPAPTTFNDEMDPWVSTADRHGHQHGVQIASRVQWCQGGGCSDVPWP
jgi:hypothetical protein